MKKAFLEAADSLFGDMNAIKEVQLSRNTTTRRCEAMAVDVEEELRKDIDVCECFSL